MDRSHIFTRVCLTLVNEGSELHKTCNFGATNKSIFVRDPYKSLQGLDSRVVYFESLQGSHLDLVYFVYPCLLNQLEY